MSKLALLLGFRYSNSDLLPGAAIDIYLAQQWVKTFTTNITMLTDFTINPDDYDTEIGQGLVKKDIYQLTPTVIHDKASLHQVLDQLTYPERVIIYYTGHGTSTGLKLPDGTIYPADRLKDYIYSHLNSTAEVCWIFDCCHAPSLDLPYKLVENEFTQIAVSHPTIKTLVLSSAREVDDVVATASGSLYSKHLFTRLRQLTISGCPDYPDLMSWLSEKNRNLSRLSTRLAQSMKKEDNVNYQPMIIYSSHRQDPVLWMWIGSNFEIQGDPHLSLA